MSFANLKVGAKLAVAFVVMIALSVLMGVVALAQLGTINHDTEEIATNWLVGTRLLGEVDSGLNEFRRAEIQMVLGIDTVDASEKRLDTAKKRIEKAMGEYQATITSDGERQLFNDLKGMNTAHYASTAKLAQLVRGGEEQLAESKKFLNGESRTTFRVMAGQIGKLVELNTKGSDEAYAESKDAYTTARNWIIAQLIISIVVAVVFAQWITRLIKQPIDEGVRTARRIAEGDLTMHVRASAKDEIGDLLRALSDMQDTLAGIVGGVRRNSEGVASASAQIASGNHDLSARTEQQASALEETAASMEELNSTVRQNADSARQASQLATNASAVAVKGGEVVQRVVETMKGINDSSRKISDIIGVIDGIAFQTNILALNAAVEAARAGEQGRGFAVVASEVRSLAGRSAEAAKEIKGLIGASVERVEHGTQLVDQAGTTMTEIVSSIRRVTDIVAEISAASDEQSNGVAQIDQAVTQMDTSTQQNAALVEEMAAAASSLKGQAEELVSAVSVFRTRD